MKLTGYSWRKRAEGIIFVAPNGSVVAGISEVFCGREYRWHVRGATIAENKMGFAPTLRAAKAECRRLVKIEIQKQEATCQQQ